MGDELGEEMDRESSFEARALVEDDSRTLFLDFTIALSGFVGVFGMSNLATTGVGNLLFEGDLGVWAAGAMV